MAVIDRANAFYLRPVAEAGECSAMHYDSEVADEVQKASAILDFGEVDPSTGFKLHQASTSSIGGYVNVVTSGTAGGTVTLYHGDTLDAVDEAVPGGVITLAAGTKVASIAMPAHKRFVKAELATLTAANTDVYIGARADVVA